MSKRRVKKTIKASSTTVNRALGEKKEQGIPAGGKLERGRQFENFGQVMDGYERALLLKGFADSGRAPKMTDVEVAVCFADLRGFTQYVHQLQKDGQDNKVQNFLKDYFGIYPMSVLYSIWNLEPDDHEEISEIDAELRKLIVPASYKNLGDGMMIVWELQTASTTVVQGLATRYIIEIVQGNEQNFIQLTRKLGAVEIDSYSRHVSELGMGFGLTRGHAWRLEFGYHSAPDYAGSIVNLAARLQGLARPSGIVAQLGFSESIFHQFVKKKKGSIHTIDSPKGFGTDSIQIWISNKVVLAPPETMAAK